MMLLGKQYYDNSPKGTSVPQTLDGALRNFYTSLTTGYYLTKRIGGGGGGGLYADLGPEDVYSRAGFNGTYREDEAWMARDGFYGDPLIVTGSGGSVSNNGGFTRVYSNDISVNVNGGNAGNTSSYTNSSIRNPSSSAWPGDGTVGQGGRGAHTRNGGVVVSSAQSGNMGRVEVTQLW